VQVGGIVMWNVGNAPGLIYTGTITRGSATGAMGYAAPAPNPGWGSFLLVCSTGTAPPEQRVGNGRGGGDPVVGRARDLAAMAA
jgi:hypothetical protein